MSAIPSQSSSDALIVISANIEGLTANKHPYYLSCARINIATVYVSKKPTETKIKQGKAPNGYSLRVVGVPQSIGTVQIVSTSYPASPEARAPSFLGSQSCDSAAWLAERQLLAGDI